MDKTTLILAFFFICSTTILAEDVAERRCRAGNPDTLSPLARWTYDDSYVGYYIGGGASHFKRKGEGRYSSDGVWGMDYNIVLPRFRNGVVLNWWHGRRHQDGGGTYEPDHANHPFASHLIDKGIEP